MSFFDIVDSSRVVERNIQNLNAIEVKQAKDMLKHFVAARKRIKQSLSQTIPDSFSEAQLELTLDQVDIILNELRARTSRQSREGSMVLKEQSIEDFGKEVRKFSKKFEGVERTIPVDEVLFSLQSENILLNRYESSLNRYTDSMRNDIQRELTQSIISSEPKVRMINRISDQLQLKEWQVLRIARTELHNIYNMSKNEGMINVRDTLIPDLKKSLFHPMDSRTGEDSKAMDRANLVVDLDEPFKFSHNGQDYVFFTPPNRPNDRAIVVPYRKEWDN